jgi:membrane-associated phospholipid phosphatase
MAKLAVAQSAVAAIFAASLLALGVLTHTDVLGWLGIGVFAVLFALSAAAGWNVRRHYRKLDKAANAPGG